MIRAALVRACVIGDPIAHSRSPLIHGYWLKQLGIDGSYGRRHVQADSLADFVQELRSGAYRGCNVTVPHKEAVLALADQSSEAARIVGAANTLWLDERQALCADNTDIAGLLAHLDQSAPCWQERTDQAVVLGAGGAARAAIHGLLSRGVARVHVVNRTLERAEVLADRFGPRVSPIGWDGLPAALAGAGLLVNTTSLGMTGQPPLRIDLTPMPSGAVVYDIVYVPLETDLLAQARHRGLIAVDGLGMLLHQAVPGFARWFGRTPVVDDTLRSLVVADIEGKR